MPFSPTTVALLALAALAAGIVDAIGGGGGLITLPALLAAGLPAPLALGTNKGQSVFGSLAALLRYRHAGLVDPGRARIGFPFGLGGSLAGASLVLLVPPAVLRPLVLLLLIAAGALLVLRPAPSGAPARRSPRHAAALAAGVALAIGAYDGFFGPGTGTFLILAFVSLFGARMQEATADAKVVNFASNLAAVALFAIRGKVLWGVSLPMAAGQLAGGLVGAHLAVRRGDRFVRAVAALVALGLVVKVAIDLASG